MVKNDMIWYLAVDRSKNRSENMVVEKKTHWEIKNKVDPNLIKYKYWNWKKTYYIKFKLILTEVQIISTKNVFFLLVSNLNKKKNVFR